MSCRDGIVQRPNHFQHAADVANAVVNRAGVAFGQVDHLIETGANDVLVIRGERGETLVPFVAGRYVLEVDLDRKRILVDWESDWTAGD